MKMIIQSVCIACGLSFLTGAFAAAPSITIYPQSLEVSYGATGLPGNGGSGQYKLQYYIVNNSAGSGSSGTSFTLTPSLTPTDPGAVQGRITDIEYSTPPSSAPNACTGSGNTFTLSGKTGAICNLYVTFKATNPTTGPSTPLTYQFKLAYKGSDKEAGTVSPPQNLHVSFATGQQIGSRPFTFQNNCGYPVVLGISGGSTSSISQSDPGHPSYCTGPSDCYPGSQCVATGYNAQKERIHQCFWDNPSASSGYTLQPKAHSVINVPVYDNAQYYLGNNPVNQNSVWSGGVTARIYNSTEGQFVVGDCGTGTQSEQSIRGTEGCSPGQGFAGPVTTAEMTLINDSALVQNNSVPQSDTYDVTVINGVSVPISMGPTTGAAASYTCGVAGSASNTDSPRACSWNFTPPSGTSPFNSNQMTASDFVAVDYTGSYAPTAGKCKSGDILGLAFNPNGNETPTANPYVPFISKVCGQPLAGPSVDGQLPVYWSPDELCGRDPNYGNPKYAQYYPGAVMNCALGLSAPNSTADTATNLYACHEAKGGNPPGLGQTCYGSGDDSCCGASTWPGIVNDTKDAFTPNPNWTKYAEPVLSWLKQGCSTSYVFPYDDKSSTFTCGNASSALETNTQGYTITFCPKP